MPRERTGFSRASHCAYSRKAGWSAWAACAARGAPIRRSRTAGGKQWIPPLIGRCWSECVPRAGPISSPPISRYGVGADERAGTERPSARCRHALCGVGGL